eukprot:TRINITY_DN2506_c0_g1_i3.p2 TRINITY_DN2506_c0_g1~~TRINITY_DN2506_c0_g1_i3.p2  ORF type:complete len:258 (-),score=62.46 TRINITY_DN2506_c0_g1_i3:396-1169(-)
MEIQTPHVATDDPWAQQNINEARAEKLTKPTRGHVIKSGQLKRNNINVNTKMQDRKGRKQKNMVTTSSPISKPTTKEEKKLLTLAQFAEQHLTEKVQSPGESRIVKDSGFFSNLSEEQSGSKLLQQKKAEKRKGEKVSVSGGQPLLQTAQSTPNRISITGNSSSKGTLGMRVSTSERSRRRSEHEQRIAIRKKSLLLQKEGSVLDMNEMLFRNEQEKEKELQQSKATVVGAAGKRKGFVGDVRLLGKDPAGVLGGEV